MGKLPPAGSYSGNWGSNKPYTGKVSKSPNTKGGGGSPPKKGCGGKKKMFATLAMLVIAAGMQAGLAVQIAQTII